MRRKCLFLLLAAGLLGHATGQARIITKSKIGQPVKQNSEIAAPYVEPTAVKGGKSLGVADSIASMIGNTQTIWRGLGAPGGRNIGEDFYHNLIVVYARASGSSSKPYIIMQGYFYADGSTWSSSELFPGDSLYRCYSAVEVDAQGWPHFAAQRNNILYYLRDEAGIGGGFSSTPLQLHDSSLALSSPCINVRGPEGENIYITAQDIDNGNVKFLDGSGGLPSWVDLPVDGLPIFCTNDDGKELFIATMSGQCVIGSDTLTEFPFFSYSHDSGKTWQYGGALNTADTTVPRAGLARVAGGWWNIGSAVFDHNGIVHVLWTSMGSTKAVNGGVDTIEYDPLVHSYNAAPGDYSSWTHEIVGNPAVYDTVNDVMTGWHDFSCISVTPDNVIAFIFCDAYATTGYTGLWYQIKSNSDYLLEPVLNNAITDVNCGSWCETSCNMEVSGFAMSGATEFGHVIWGKGGDTWSNVTTLMHSQLVYTADGVCGEATLKNVTYGFKLDPNIPNPVKTKTNIFFSLPKAGQYKLRIYNISGQLVKTLDGQGPAGKNTLNWDCRDDRGKAVSNGMYFYSLQAGGNRATKKMVVLR